ncbi:U-box domain-containing protein 62 isoform X2 [Manihot esculenta]|uniref:U-box domain-containing protein n=1 Tax=Manihot esculenta TaxID=3983 RepID=A0A2C9V200_MANES|nr:U-box domain-containing protein 62 isoform X2 [Manihot esculenta]
MSAEEISLVPSQNGLNSQLVFQDDPLRFNCGPPQRRVGGDPGPKRATRELTGFIDDKLFSTSNSAADAANNRYFSSHQGGPEFPRNMYRENRNWNGTGTSGEESDGDEDEDEDDEDDVDDEDDDVGGGDGDHDNEVGALVGVNSSTSNTNNNNNSGKSNNNNTATTTSTTSNTGNVDKMGNGNGRPKHHPSFGATGELMAVKDGGGSIGQTGNNTVTIAEPDGDMYYSQYLQATEGSGGAGKDMGVENGCGFSGRKEGSSFSCESGESLRAILSDPVTGALMDDAMILPCGHSFGAGGIQHVIRMKSCYTCSQSVSEDLIASNLSLRAAVQAFRREEELQFYRSSKRRRERFDQDKGVYGDSPGVDTPRGRGVQFPFVVTDRVIIKGNKRTPQRFVGREAVVTTQCLNGWYVVKTLDNAESVKLQYRSLEKVSDDPSSKATSSKMPPNWL